MNINRESINEMLKKILKGIGLIFYSIFVLALLISGVVTGILTLIPDEASKPCYLGYYAHCSFTPYSTLILFGMAAVGVILLIFLIRSLKKQYKNEIKVKPIPKF